MVCVGGRYQLLGELGRGGTSTVFLAVDTVLHKQWAVKETLLQGDEDCHKRIIQSLRAEVEVLKECDHPAIPRIVDFFEENGRAYAVRDYVKCNSLKSIVDDHGLQDALFVRDLGMQLCAVFSYLHSHYPPIIYCDLKPSHVMIADDGTVRLIDFGAATQLYSGTSALDLRSIDQADSRFVTPRFSAPELLDDSSTIAASTDVYAIGMTLRYALLPSDESNTSFHSATSSHCNRALLEQLVAVLVTATAQQQSQRYQDCEAMFYALQSCNGEEERLYRSKNSKRKNNSRENNHLKDTHRKDNGHENNRREYNIQETTCRGSNYRGSNYRGSNKNNSSRILQQAKSASLLNNKPAIAIFITVIAVVLMLLLSNCLGAMRSDAAIKQTKQSSDSLLKIKNKRINDIRRNKDDYDSYMRLAERESNMDVAGRYISHAMQIQQNMLKKNYVRTVSFKPLNMLLRAHLVDQQWSTAEEHTMMDLINKYEKQLRSNHKDWANFAKGIAKAYWYYFAGFSGKVANSERLSRMRIAKVWFVEAKKYEKNYSETEARTKAKSSESSVSSASKQILKNMQHKNEINTYIAIADGYARLVDITQDSPSVKTYKQYGNQLEKLLQIVQQDQSDMLQVDTGELVLQSLRSWMRMFKESGFRKQEIQQWCNNAKNLLEKSKVTNEEAKLRQKTALESYSQICNEIVSVFEEK